MAKTTALEKYLTKRKISAVEAAAMLDITRQYVWAIASGRIRPGFKLASKIEKWTKGAVRMQEWAA